MDTLREHLKKASQARWDRTSKEERVKHAKAMAEARWAKHRVNANTGAQNKSENTI